MGLTVDIAAVGDANDQDNDLFVLNFADDAVVAHAVAPVTTEVGAGEGFADATRIFETGDALSHEPR